MQSFSILLMGRGYRSIFASFCSTTKKQATSVQSFSTSTINVKSLKDQIAETLRIHHECQGGIEKSIWRIIDWHHEAWRVMTNGDREGQIFLSHPQTNIGFFFLLTTIYLILNSKNMMKRGSRKS